MAAGPKSFWAERDRELDGSAQWITFHDDDPLLTLEAELIHICTRMGLSWRDAEEMELWQVAAALGLHRIETREEHDTREIVEQKSEYWDETGAERMERMAKVAAERKARALERKQQKAAQRTGKTQ